MAFTPSPGSRRQWSRMGTRKDSVLPEPVPVATIVLRPPPRLGADDPRRLQLGEAAAGSGAAGQGDEGVLPEQPLLVHQPVEALPQLPAPEREAGGDVAAVGALQLLGGAEGLQALGDHPSSPSSSSSAHSRAWSGPGSTQ